MELDPRIDWSPERLAEIKVATGTGTLVPIGAFARIERNAGLLTVNQLGQLPAVTISYNLPNGVALGDSIKEIDRLKTRLGVPQAVSTTFYGTAKTFEDAAANQGLLILGAIITIYIVLGILYESFIHPLTILSGLPAAAAGALLAIGWSGFDLSVIAVIGLLMLIGIVKKNAIMMIDVALTLRRDGASADRGDLPGLPDALSPDHDDDVCRDDEHLADRLRRGRQRRAAPAAGHRGGRRPHRFADADAVRDAGALSLHGAAVGVGAAHVSVAPGAKPCARARSNPSCCRGSAGTRRRPGPRGRAH